MAFRAIEPTLIFDMRDLDEKIGVKNRERFCDLWNKAVFNYRRLEPEEQEEMRKIGKMILGKEE